MRASELIEKLEKLKKKHGNAEVTVSVPHKHGSGEVVLINAYDKQGRGTKDPGFTRTSCFHIHSM